jgi:hypothetical protein
MPTPVQGRRPPLYPRWRRGGGFLRPRCCEGRDGEEVGVGDECQCVGVRDGCVVSTCSPSTPDTPHLLLPTPYPTRLFLLGQSAVWGLALSPPHRLARERWAGSGRPRPDRCCRRFRRQPAAGMGCRRRHGGWRRRRCAGRRGTCQGHEGEHTMLYHCIPHHT